METISHAIRRRAGATAGLAPLAALCLGATLCLAGGLGAPAEAQSRGAVHVAPDHGSGAGHHHQADQDERRERRGGSRDDDRAGGDDDRRRGPGYDDDGDDRHKPRHRRRDRFFYYSDRYYVRGYEPGARLPEVPEAVPPRRLPPPPDQAIRDLEADGPDPRGTWRRLPARGAAAEEQEIRVGAVLPAGVPIVVLDWRRYGLAEPAPGIAYARIGAQIALIDPATRRVLSLLEPSAGG